MGKGVLKEKNYIGPEIMSKYFGVILRQKIRRKLNINIDQQIDLKGARIF